MCDNGQSHVTGGCSVMCDSGWSCVMGGCSVMCDSLFIFITSTIEVLVGQRFGETKWQVPL